ncbi:hypothetical protein N7468_004607 [Penicillium chermesinum]|uniref:Uncharacterized protein n=1 Tax=Penicillium chermesinum TaxID=63820 RepID=A0A9W9P8R8_9EURO|nr:uncharacterized protein N7468_004607 [Penicillium chermesinum]KAJ5239988.1 hypothetical protein N7468_004607 [Penicillium chermesinum]KAJ6166863.1 hypothetical protein N7470_002310 [Penicillium chermesinum]
MKDKKFTKSGGKRMSIRLAVTPAAKTTKISIVIYHGAAPETAGHHHVALHIQFEGSEELIAYMSNTFAAHSFLGGTRHAGRGEQTIEALLFVAFAPNTLTRGMLDDILARTRIREDGHEGGEEWSCQEWVKEALLELELAGAITANERTEGIAKMFESISDSEDPDRM